MNQKTAKILLKKVKKDYQKISDEFDTTRQYNWKEFQDFVLFIKNHGKILDLGCGNGRFYKFIHEKKDIDYIGIDNNPDLLEKAQKQNENAKFIKGDILKIPLKDNSIDTLVSVASLHHIPSKQLRQKALAEIKRVLNPGGIAIVSVWNLFQPKYKKYIWKARFKYLLSLCKYDVRDTFIPWGKSGVERYYYAFTQKELRKLLLKDFNILKESKGNNFVFICQKK